MLSRIDLPSNLDRWDLGDTEVAYVCCNGKYTNSNGSLALYIPKLMPAISNNGKATILPATTLMKACFINDAACKPAVANSIRTQTFKTLRTQSNRTFQYPLINRGSRIIIDIRNQNPDTMFVSTKEDPSFKLP